MFIDMFPVDSKHFSDNTLSEILVKKTNYLVYYDTETGKLLLKSGNFFTLFKVLFGINR